MPSIELSSNLKVGQELKAMRKNPKKARPRAVFLMPDRTRKRPHKANALARWDNEGGAAKGAPQQDRDELTSLTEDEEHILRRLGAAVIMQWNDLPRAIQHELFDHAISMRKVLHTAKLKRQIARFLHKHKDDDREPG
jgi:hypothetical protein